MRRGVGLLVLAAACLALSGSLANAGERRATHTPHRKVDPDCVPLNGRSGYYGNPWCDTGSYRLEDIWFRERQAQMRRWKPRR